MADFRLRAVPLLSRVGADRSDELRTDIDAAVAGWTDAAVLWVDGRGQALVAGNTVVLSSTGGLGDTPPAEAVFVGRLPDGRHAWALRGPLPDPGDAAARVVDLRRGGVDLDDLSAQLLVTATALLNWHDNARFSPIDGTPTRVVRAGWARADPVTGREEFPRIDPAIIALVHDGGDRIVLARQHGWPERMYSLLAGFVEAGESFETCVVREIREEIGIDVTDVRYLGSQPWPFPRSLMVGFHALGDPAQSFAYLDGEIAEARWFSRAQVCAALAAGDWTTPGSTAEYLLPGAVSIAREIIESWAYAEQG